MLRFVSLCLLFLSCALCPLQAAKWLHVRTQHFEIYGDCSKGVLTEVSNHLEKLVDVYTTFAPTSMLPGDRTLVLVCHSHSDFRSFAGGSVKHPEELGALIVACPGARTFVFRDSRDSVLRESLMNRLMGNVWARGLTGETPLWIAEAYAQLFSTIEFKGDHFQIGKPDPVLWRRKDWSDVGPLSEMLTVRQSSDVYMETKSRQLFQLQCWAFLHMCLLGKDPSLEESLFKYFAQQAQASDKAACLERCFGMSLEELDRRLNSYIRGGIIRNRVVPLKGRGTAKVEFLPCGADELQAVRLGIRSIQPGAGVSAYDAFSAFDRLGPDAPVALLSFAAWASRAHDDASRMERFTEMAVAAGSRDGRLHCSILADEVRNLPSDLSYRMPADLAERLNKRIETAWALIPDDFGLLTVMSYAQCFAPKTDPRIQERLEHALEAGMLSDHAKLHLAYLRWRLGDSEGGAKLLGDIRALPAGAHSLLGELKTVLKQGRPWKPVM